MRHLHNLDSYRLLTGNLGQLLPAGLVEVLPGDVFNHSASLMVRVSPMAAPVMHPMTARVHHLFVPHRLSWPDGYAVSWEDFITGGPDGNASDPLPTMNSTGVAGDLLDYLGVPTEANIEISALPLRAVNLCFNEWFRDQDLVTERSLTDTSIPKIAWGKDYYQTARPWPQKGDEVTLPLGTSADVHTASAEGATVSVYSDAEAEQRRLDASGATATVSVNSGTSATKLYADLSNATAATVNAIRRAFALQRFAENRARYGSRYPEYLRLLGVRSADARLQRPEYLGGGTARISVSEVLQTAPDSSADPDAGVGDMYGHGIAMTRSNAYRRKFTEHGYVITFVSVRPRSLYATGVDRTFLRRDREDFWQRELEHIGQQPVLEQELYADSTNAANIFGYSDRYQEYRFQPSRVSGEFRTTLDHWHLGRLFGSAPALNASFIECDPSKRVFNDQTTHSLWMAVQHNLKARRLVTRRSSGRIL